MQVNCINCGHRFDLKDAYDDYEGYVKCSTCRCLLHLKSRDGQVLGVMPGMLAGQAFAPAPAAAPAPAPVPAAAPAPAPMPAAPAPAPAGTPAPSAAPAPPPTPAAAPGGWTAAAVPPPSGTEQSGATGDADADAETERIIADTSDSIGSILADARHAAGLDEDADASQSSSTTADAKGAAS